MFYSLAKKKNMGMKMDFSYTHSKKFNKLKRPFWVMLNITLEKFIKFYDLF